MGDTGGWFLIRGLLEYWNGDFCIFFAIGEGVTETDVRMEFGSFSKLSCAA